MSDKESSLIDSLRAMPQAELQLDHSIYVIMFDELSWPILRQHLKEHPEKFPNFSSVQSTFKAAQLATTNFEMTEFAVPSFLAGRLLGPSYSPEERWLQPNLFDFFSDDRLFVSGADSPYCWSLKKRGRNAWCQDETTTLAQQSLATSLKSDVTRFGVVFLGRCVAEFTYRALDLIGVGMDRGKLADWLTLMRFGGAFNVGEDNFRRELMRIENVEPRLGRVAGALYYLHLDLPHFPYIANGSLQIDPYNRFAYYGFASTPEDIGRIDLRYQQMLQAADTLLGKLLSTIEQRDPQSLIFITSDHGVPRKWPTALERPTGELLPDVVEIPFFFRLPATESPSIHPSMTYQHIDFLPSLFGILKRETELQFDGRNLINDLPSSFYFETDGKSYRSYPLLN